MNKLHSIFAATIAAVLAVLCALAPAGARAQGSRKDDIALGARGTPLAGASVAICAQPAVTTTTPCSPLATLYANVGLTQALANPLTTDGLGNYNFYAAPGKYTIQIYGPNVTTKILPDVILPSDPSSPTFASVTTTSGITAFSLSLSGNLSVAGNSAVTGTLTVGGAPVPSVVQDLQWTNNQRFKGPIPARDITAFGPPGGCPQLYYFAPPSGTIAAASHTLTISGGAYAATNGCGVAVYGAGPSSALATPGTLAVSAHTYTGATTYCYEVAAVDNNLGMSAASAHTCIANGVATRARDSYNFISWTVVPNAVAYVIYESATSGGTYSAIGTSYVSAYCDMGFANAPVPDFAPSTAPAGVTPQALFTTIASGGGSSSLTLSAAASNSATSQPVYQDDSWMLAAAIAASNPNADGFSPIYVIPPGLYWFPHLPVSVTGSMKIEQRGTVYLTALPLIANTHWDGYGGGGNLSGGNGQYAAVAPDANVGAAFVTSAGDIENISAGNLFGDGIVVQPGASNRFENIAISEAANGAGAPVRIDGDVIVLLGKNWTLQASALPGGPPAIWFNRETAVNPDSDIRVSQFWISYHALKFDAPGGVNGNPNQLITFENGQTEENYDHGFVVADGGISGNEGYTQIELRNINQDTNYSNFNPSVLEIGPHLSTVQLLGGGGAAVSPTASSAGACFGGACTLNTQGFDPSLQAEGFCAVNTEAGGFNPGAQITGPGVASVCSGGSLLDQNLAVMGPAAAVSTGNVQWGQLVSAPATTVFSLTATTGTGTLAAGTYYYRISCIHADGGETLATGELSATLSSTGRVNIFHNGTLVPGCMALRVYVGTASGGETQWLKSGGNNYSVSPEPNNNYIEDDGSFTRTAGSPSNWDTAFYSKLMMDAGAFSYLQGDGCSGAACGRLGIGTMTDPGNGSGIKLDVAGGAVRGQSGFVAGLSDPAFTNSPRAVYHAFIPTLTATLTGATLTLDKGVTVTRVQAQAITAPAGCATNAIVRVSDGSTPINVTLSAAANDSGAITQNYAGGAAVTISVSTAAAGCTTSPANVNVEVQYRMQ